MSTTTTHLFTVSGMHCASCGLLIDDALEDLPGVHTSQTSLKTSVTTVRFDESVISPADIVAAICATGYPASTLA